MRVLRGVVSRERVTSSRLTNNPRFRFRFYSRHSTTGLLISVSALIFTYLRNDCPCDVTTQGRFWIDVIWATDRVGSGRVTGLKAIRSSPGSKIRTLFHLWHRVSGGRKSPMQLGSSAEPRWSLWAKPVGEAPRSQIHTDNLQLSNAFLRRFVAESILHLSPTPKNSSVLRESHDPTRGRVGTRKQSAAYRGGRDSNPRIGDIFIRTKFYPNLVLRHLKLTSIFLLLQFFFW